MKNLLVLGVLVFLSTAVYSQNVDFEPFDMTTGLTQFHDIYTTEKQRELWMKYQMKRHTQISEHLTNLKDGVLIFRLKTNAKALKKLEGILNNPNTKESSKRRILQKTMPNMKATTQKLNDKLIRAFAEKYDFSAVYFMPDTCTNSLQNDYPLTCLTDAGGNAISDNVLEEKSIFIADFSELENNTTTRIKGLIISDKNAERLTPGPIYFQSEGNVFIKLFSKDITSKNAQRMIEKWNSNLHDFFELSTEYIRKNEKNNLPK